LTDANITVDQLESVILHGGSVRVPFVQKILEDTVGSDKLAKTVNADEGAVMGISSSLIKLIVGAIFRGAQLNNQFRVKDIRTKDYSIYPIEITSNAITETSKDLTQPLFPRGTKLGRSKTLSFKSSQDVSFTIQYTPDSLPNDISPTILTASVTGVAEKIEKLKGSNECFDPLVKVNIKLTDSGLVEVLHAEVRCEIREKKNLADKFMGLFGGGNKEEKEEDQVRREREES
jgi:hypoxia up-regulated 1